MTTILSILPEIRDMIGDSDAEHYEWSDQRLIDATHKAITLDYNQARVKQQYSVTGTGTSKTITPVPTNETLNLIVLFATKKVLSSDQAKYSRLAVKISSPLGTRDMKDINKDIKAAKRDIEAEIQAAIEALWHDDMIDDGIEVKDLTADTSAETET